MRPKRIRHPLKKTLLDLLRTGVVITIAGLAALSAPASSQEPEHEGEIEGVVRDAETGAPLAGALVSVIGTGTRAVTHGDGTFHLTGIADGSYSLRVDRLGYRGSTTEVTVGDESAVVVIELVTSPIALQGMVVTATLTERGAAEALRPVSVMAGEELQRRMEATIAATLAAMPGMAVTSMGPAVSQPVIRGLSGDRVLLLEDGTAVGDASNSGSDHTTGLDPASARRIEVVRGPGALLYGGNALGGVINVIRDEIPSAVPHHVTGSATLQTQTVTGSLSGSATAVFAVAEHVPLRVEGAVRTGGDLKTPLGTLPNTDGDLWSGGVGTAYVAEWGHLGASFRGYRNHYGIPGGFVGGHEEGVRIEMERAASKFRTLVDDPVGLFQDIRFDATHTWYRHRETGATGNPRNPLREADRQWGTPGPTRRIGTLHSRSGGRSFFLGGLRVRRKPVHAGHASQQGVSVLSGRGRPGICPDRMGATATTGPEPIRWRVIGNSDIGKIRNRTFNSLSGSLGVLYTASSGLTLGVSLTRAFRTPDINELYSEGPHLAAYSFEVGNPSLEGEIGRGLDVFLRFESDRVRAEVTGFYNDIEDYVYGEDTGRLSRVLLPIYQFRGNDAVFSGFEAAADLAVGRGMALEAVVSSVKGSLKATEQPLPLVPPLKGHLALKYERPLWFIRAETEMASRQDRIGEFEMPTGGYTVLNLSAGARVTLGGRLNVLTVSLDNATDAEYRNHLSRVKEIMPEAGRGLSVTYRVVF